MATGEELKRHLGNSLSFLEQNKGICEANTVILYAWNEFDEGGWLCPTYMDGEKINTDRINALSEVLK